jgi:hypothetical protein
LATKHHPQQPQRVVVVSPGTAPCVAAVSSSTSAVASSAPPASSRLLGHMKSNYCRRGPPRRGYQVPRLSMAAALRHTIDLCSDTDSSSDDSETDGSDGKHVQFAKRCTVVEIPHYREYSPEQKELLWNGRKEIRTMARRNTLEYQYDGWTVESAAEEDQFVLVQGEHVHPCHAPADDDDDEEEATTSTTLPTTIPRDAE